MPSHCLDAEANAKTSAQKNRDRLRSREDGSLRPSFAAHAHTQRFAELRLLGRAVFVVAAGGSKRSPVMHEAALRHMAATKGEGCSFGARSTDQLQL